MMWHDFERNKQTAETCAWNEKKYCSCCFTLIRIDTIVSKNIYNNFQSLLFKNMLAQSSNQADILEILLTCRHLCSPKTIGWVLGYTTLSIYTWNLLVCNSGQYIYVTGLHNFFFVLQDLIERINCYFQRIAFWRNLLFIDF